MVGRKIREYPGIEFNSVDAAHLEPYGRDLHADRLAAAVRHLAQNLLKLIGFGGRVDGRYFFVAVERADSADNACFYAAVFERTAQDISYTCLALRAGYAYHFQLIRRVAEEVYAHLREVAARVFAHQHDCIIGQAERLFRNEHAAAEVICALCVFMSVSCLAFHADKSRARSCLARVVDYIAYIRLRIITRNGRALKQFFQKHCISPVKSYFSNGLITKPKLSFFSSIRRSARSGSL